MDQLKGVKKNFIEVAPLVLYGITDKCSLFVEFPIAVHSHIAPNTSRGLEDVLVQFEGLVYAKESAITVNEVTLVANIGIPSGSATKVPPTGFGAVSFFLGTTLSHTAIDWYYFASFGLIMPTSHNNTKFGKEFLYQWGVSRNIWYKTDKWLLNWMIELDGIYRQRPVLAGVRDKNNGGNLIILGPSLWFSTQHVIAQIGLSGAIAQHLFGDQTKERYYVAANIGWKF